MNARLFITNLPPLIYFIKPYILVSISVSVQKYTTQDCTMPQISVVTQVQTLALCLQKHTTNTSVFCVKFDIILKAQVHVKRLKTADLALIIHQKMALNDL